MDSGALRLLDPILHAAPQPLRVGVLVDLALGAASGGHVKCWERLAQAAARLPPSEALDLTVHFAGPARGETSLAEHVRYVLEPPIFSTSRLRFLSHVPDHTDLARWHPTLAAALPRYDVIHTTDAYFAYARTAVRVSRRHGIPLVHSVHTNTPEYARLFASDTVERLFGGGSMLRRLELPARLGDAVKNRMLRAQREHERHCAFVLVSRPEQLPDARTVTGGRAALLRRGLDHGFFLPHKRDRLWLARRHGVPPERVVVLAVGRLNRGKNIMLLVDAMEELLSRGVDLQLLCAGDGDLRPRIVERLGARATCPGSVEPQQLARLYACADIFALPSLIEESANVVLEALSSGLPVLVARESGMGRRVVENATGSILPGDDLRCWQDAIAALAADAARRAAMGRSARRYAERHVPSWAEVLREDLLPRWREAALRRRAPA